MSLCFDSVTVRRQGKTLLDSVSLVVRPGEFVVVIGPNGAGKSTLMRTACGLLLPDEGAVLIDGCDLRERALPEWASRRAMLTQDQTLQARFSVRELAGLGIVGRQARHGVSRYQSIISEALADVGLIGFESRDVTGLSGGERQRAHLARVLVQLRWHGDKGYLLLDEPVSAQDIARQEQVLSLARAHVGKGGACLAILHDLNWAAACADRLVVRHRGRIYADGPPGEVMTSTMLSEVFALCAPATGHHHESGRPFLLPHDLVTPGSNCSNGLQR